MKSKLDKSALHKEEHVLVDLKKLSHVVNKKVVKKA